MCSYKSRTRRMASCTRNTFSSVRDVPRAGLYGSRDYFEGKSITFSSVRPCQLIFRYARTNSHIPDSLDGYLVLEKSPTSFSDNPCARESVEDARERAAAARTLDYGGVSHSERKRRARTCAHCAGSGHATVDAYSGEPPARKRKMHMRYVPGLSSAGSVH